MLQESDAVCTENAIFAFINGFNISKNVWPTFYIVSRSTGLILESGSTANKDNYKASLSGYRDIRPPVQCAPQYTSSIHLIPGTDQWSSTPELKVLNACFTERHLFLPLFWWFHFYCVILVWFNITWYQFKRTVKRREEIETSQFCTKFENIIPKVKRKLSLKWSKESKEPK